MPSGTVDRRLASFCMSRLRAVRTQAKSDRNYPVLPYLWKNLHTLSSLKPKSVNKVACRHKAQDEESLARSDSSRAASLQGVTYRAKVKVMLIPFF